MPRKGRQVPSKDDPGGEVVTVEVRVNRHLVYSRSVVLNQSLGGNSVRYKSDDGDFFVFNRDWGVLSLAENLLKPKGGRGV